MRSIIILMALLAASFTAKSQATFAFDAAPIVFKYNTITHNDYTDGTAWAVRGEGEFVFNRNTVVQAQDGYTNTECVNEVETDYVGEYVLCASTDVYILYIDEKGVPAVKYRSTQLEFDITFTNEN